MAKAKVARKRIVDISPEPKWEKKTPSTRIDVLNALNWYNANKDDKDAAKYLKVPVALVKGFNSLAWATRMLGRGFTFSAGESLTMVAKNEQLEVLVKADKKAKKKAAKEKGPVLTVQDRIQMKTDQIIGEMEGALVDKYGIGAALGMNAYQWMVDNEVNAIHAPKIIEYFREQSKEPYAALDAIMKGEDTELAEGYSSYSKKELLHLVMCYSHIIKDAERLSLNAKKTRKPRKKKTISAEKKIAKLNYMERYDALKLVSANPAGILGKNSLWVYNTKTRKLGLYLANDDAGLDVKGSTIQNFMTAQSICKTLRKPEEVLPKVLSGGKVALRTLLLNIKAKPTKLTGRLNRDTVILRIV